MKVTISNIVGLILFTIGFIMGLTGHQAGNYALYRLGFILGGVGIALIAFSQAFRMFKAYRQ